MSPQLYTVIYIYISLYIYINIYIYIINFSIVICDFVRLAFLLIGGNFYLSCAEMHLWFL